MYRYVIREEFGRYFVEDIFTGGRSQLYLSKPDAEAVRNWLQFERA